MDEQRRKELADFLRTRRLRMSPQGAGIPFETSHRRTLGLRREEVCALSGISLPWYTALEQGRDIRVSDQVLESLARTFRLSGDERDHLYILASQSIPQRVSPTENGSISPALQHILDRMGNYPAYISDKRWNVIAWNASACAIFGDFSRMTELERNILWRMFMFEEYRSNFVNWREMAQTVLAQFRSRYARYAVDPWYQELIDKLSEASDEFRTMWLRHDVLGFSEGKKKIRHKKVGMLILKYNTFSALENEDLKFTIFTPVENTGTAEKLEKLLT